MSNNTTTLAPQSKNVRIDYSKYQVDEVVETIADAIVFPFYIGKVMATVVVASLLLIIGLAYFNTTHWSLGILFTLLTFVVSLPSIILISVIRLIRTICDDINNVIEITIETAKHVYNDSGLIKAQRQNGLPLKSSFTDVFRGVSLYVIRPSLQRVLSKRLGPLAFIFTFIVDRLFKYIVIKKQPVFEVEVAPNNDGIGEHIEVAAKPLDEKVLAGSQKVTAISGKVIKFPFYLGLGIYGIVNLVLVKLLIWIF